MQYKVGKYVINPWLLMEKRGTIGWFEPYMERELTGTDRIVEITEIRLDRYIAIWPDGEKRHISDAHILGPALAYGEPCEVRDRGEWMKAWFISYRPGAPNQVCASASPLQLDEGGDIDSSVFKQVRRIQPDTSVIDTITQVKRLVKDSGVSTETIISALKEKEGRDRGW